MRHHLALLALALVLVAVAPARGEGPSPTDRIREEIAALASSVHAAGGADLAFVSTDSSLNLIRGRAWILTLSVGDAPAYGALYFVLSEVDGRATGELLRGAGPQGTATLTDDELARFLERVELDPTPIRGVFDRYYR